MIAKKSQSGFTMVEMIIALVILSMIMLATLTALRTFAQTQSKIEEVTARLNTTRQVTDFLRRTIGQAMPIPFAPTKGNHESSYGTYFIGEQTSLIWVAPMSFGLDAGSSFVFRLSQEDSHLWLQFAPFLDPVTEPDWDGLIKHELLADVTVFEIGFLGGRDSEWLTQWPLSQTSPALVKLTVSSAERFLPEIVVRLDDGQLHAR